MKYLKSDIEHTPAYMFSGLHKRLRGPLFFLVMLLISTIFVSSVWQKGVLLMLIKYFLL